MTAGTSVAFRRPHLRHSEISRRASFLHRRICSVRACWRRPYVHVSENRSRTPIEKHIPAHHLLRSVDRFVDLEQVRQDLTPFYSKIGRPSIDPELMIRMLLIG